MFLSLFSFLSSLSPTSSSLSSIIFLISFAMVENLPLSLSIIFFSLLFSSFLFLLRVKYFILSFVVVMGVMANCGCCYNRFCWSMVGVMVMGFVAGCWWCCDGFCGRLWVQWWWILCPVVGVMVPMVVTLVLFGLRGFFFGGGFCGRLWVWLWLVLWWLAVGGQQRRERDVVGVEGREERDEEEDRERREKEF